MSEKNSNSPNGIRKRCTGRAVAELRIGGLNYVIYRNCRRNGKF